MIGMPTFGSPAPSSLLGLVRTWLRARSGQAGPSSSAAPSDTTPSTHVFDSVRVLVVDDSPTNLNLVSAMLESRGLVPWLAADGAEAVALCRELQFDLILMDMQMPILDGLGATAGIRHFERKASRAAVPVLAYSSCCPSANVLALHGLNGSLAKPCGDQDLEDCLVQWCPTYRSAPDVDIEEPPRAQRAGALASTSP